MEKRGRQLLWVISLAILWVVGPRPVAACVCARSPVLDQYENAVYAFVGTPVALADPRAAEPIYSSDDPIAFTFKVESAWKGVATDTLVVWTPRGGSSCGYRFELGKKYVVLAGDRKGRPFTGMCSGNSLLKDALAARYLFPEPNLHSDGAVWPSVSRDDLLGYLLDPRGELRNRVGAASLLSSEFGCGDFTGLSLSKLFLAAPARSAAILASGNDSISTATALMELGYALADSDDPLVRAGGIEGLAWLARGTDLEETLRRGLSDKAERVRSAARLAMVARRDDLKTPGVGECVDLFIASIGSMPANEAWLGVHQLRFFPGQRDRILPFLKAVADSTKVERLRRTADEVIDVLQAD